MARQDEYRRSGVDYDVLDEVKREAIALASATAPLLAAVGCRDPRIPRIICLRIRGKRNTLALVVEGLGTKSIIASDYLDATGVSRFADIAQDAVAAIVNDVISVGANPLVVTAYFATGDAAWYGKRERSLDLLNGWRKACEEAGAVWGGESRRRCPASSRPARSSWPGARSAWSRRSAAGARHAKSPSATRSSCCQAAACTPTGHRSPGVSPRIARWAADRAAQRQALG